MFQTEPPKVMLLLYTWITSGLMKCVFPSYIGHNPQVENETFNVLLGQASHFGQHLSLCLPDKLQSQDQKDSICPKSNC